VPIRRGDPFFDYLARLIRDAKIGTADMTTLKFDENSVFHIRIRLEGPNPYESMIFFP
jgi:hypothetical protein